MALELLFTSAVQGLKSGSQGYCTVQCTQAMPGPLAERLEALSAYRPIYPSQSEQAKLNPVNVAYWRIRAVGKTFPVLSRIADYGLDYSQRTNKLAHHLVIEPSELTVAGPAAIAASGAAFVTQWNQKVESIQQPRRLPVAASTMGVCRHWQTVMGDAGWAGVVAEEIIKDQKQPIFLIFEPGQEVLPLIVEVQSLLPAAMRWKSTFSTYLTYLPPEAECQIRCLLKGSKEAHESLRHVNSLRIDLTQPKSAPSGPLAEAARTGVMPVQLKKAEAATAFDYESDDEPPALPGHQSFAAEPLKLQVDESGRRPGPRGRRKQYSAAPVLPQKRGMGLYIAGGVSVLVLSLVGGVVAMQFLKPGKEKPKEVVENVVQTPVAVVSDPMASVVSAPEASTGGMAAAMTVPMASTEQPKSGQVAQTEDGKAESQAMATGPDKSAVAEGSQEMRDSDFRNPDIKGISSPEKPKATVIYSNEIWRQEGKQQFKLDSEDVTIKGKLLNILFPKLNWLDGDSEKQDVIRFSDGSINTVPKGDAGSTKFYLMAWNSGELTISNPKTVSDVRIPAILMQSIFVFGDENNRQYVSLFPTLEYTLSGSLSSSLIMPEYEASSMKSSLPQPMLNKAWPYLNKSSDYSSLRLVLKELNVELPFADNAATAESEIKFTVNDTSKIIQDFKSTLTNREVIDAHAKLVPQSKWELFHARTFDTPKLTVTFEPSNVVVKFDEKFNKELKAEIGKVDTELKSQLYSASFSFEGDEEYKKKVTNFMTLKNEFVKSLTEYRSQLQRTVDENVSLKGAIQYSVVDPDKKETVTLDFIRFKEPQQ